MRGRLAPTARPSSQQANCSLSTGLPHRPRERLSSLLPAQHGGASKSLRGQFPISRPPLLALLAQQGPPPLLIRPPAESHRATLGKVIPISSLVSVVVAGSLSAFTPISPSPSCPFRTAPRCRQQCARERVEATALLDLLHFWSVFGRLHSPFRAATPPRQSLPSQTPSHPTTSENDKRALPPPPSISPPDCACRSAVSPRTASKSPAYLPSPTSAFGLTARHHLRTLSPPPQQHHQGRTIHLASSLTARSTSYHLPRASLVTATSTSARPICKRNNCWKLRP